MGDQEAGAGGRPDSGVISVRSRGAVGRVLLCVGTT